MDLIRNIRLLALVGFVSLISCEKEEIEPVSTSSEAATSSVEIKLGKKSDSPLLLRNMQRAADTLASRSQLRSGFTLSATHYYVRFLPANAVEYDTLVANKTLDFTPYPLDCEVSEGDYYHDPSLPKESITWQYTVVPVDFDFSKLNIQHEVLEELYILDDDINSEVYVLDNGSGLRSGANITWKELLTESAIQTGHMGEQTLRAKWTPSATISAYDDILERYIPLQGVKVRIRYFAFMKAYHYTDSNGYVSFSEKNTSVEYSIEWERDMWDIRDGGVQAYYNGPDRKGAWNLQIGNGTPKSLHISAIHRALYKYYYGNILGLLRPNKSVKVSYNDEIDPDREAIARVFCHRIDHASAKPEMYVYAKYLDGIRYEVDLVLSSVIHEMAHVAHYLNVGSTTYYASDEIIRESWATAIQWYVSRSIYEEFGQSILSKFDRKYNEQDWCITSRPSYTPLFIDLYDTYNEYTKSPIYPMDEVSGFSFIFLENHLNQFRTLEDVRTIAKRYKSANISDTQIDNLINTFQ